jgi:hypothetical protein
MLRKVTNNSDSGKSFSRPIFESEAFRIQWSAELSVEFLV